MERRQIRLLLVEDRASDAELVIHELRRAGFEPEWQRVDDEPGFRAKLSPDLDLILADFNLPQFDALRALAILKESGWPIPFIIVSGSVGETAAVESMRGGASDYVFKENLSRLAAAVTREVAAADQRRSSTRAKEESAARLGAIIRSALDAVVSIDAGGRVVGWNPQAETLFGWRAEEASGRSLAELIVPPQLREAHRAGLARYLRTGETRVLNRRIEVPAVNKEGREFPVELSITPITADGSQSFSAFIRDITDRKRAETSTNAHLAVSRALADAGPMDVVLGRVLEAVATSVGWDLGQIWLVDEHAAQLSCSHQWSRDGAGVDEFKRASREVRLAPTEGVAGALWTSRQPLWLEEIGRATDLALVESATANQLRSAAFTPLFSGGQVNGVLEFFSHQRRSADPSLVQLMSDLSHRIGEYISRAQAEMALRESESRFRGLFYDVAVGQALVATTETILEANPAFCRLLGYTKTELIGKTLNAIGLVGDLEAARESTRALSARRPYFQREIQLLRKDGTSVWVSVSVSATFDSAGKPTNFLLQAQDISERKLAEEALKMAQAEMQHRTHHDALTELPNRPALQERLQAAFSGTPRRLEQLALLVVNISHFKDVNDTFGHQAGDELLRQFGARIQRSLRRNDMVARLASDEFGVLLEDASEEAARAAAGKMTAALESPFTIMGQSLAVEAGIGVALYPAHADSAEGLMRCADIALHVAKRATGTSVTVYDAGFEQQGASHLTLMAELRAAIQAGGLSVYYQPLMDLKTGAVRRMEALLRWQHPALGWIPPDQFIPFAERSGVIQPLTDWVIRTVLGQLAAWRKASQPLSAAVNVSVRNLSDASFLDRVAGMLRESGEQRGTDGTVPLSIEVTEGVLMSEPEQAVERLGRLRRLGLRLSVDDFGTGYSSLAYLARLPVSEMKIDRSFITGIAGDPNKAAIVRAALDLGHSLRLEVVAEGVEDQRTLDLLAALGCDAAQGYYLSRPMPADAVIGWLQARRDASTTGTEPLAA